MYLPWRGSHLAIMPVVVIVVVVDVLSHARDASMSYFTDNGRDKKKKWYVMFSGRALLWVFVGRLSFDQKNEHSVERAKNNKYTRFW